MRESGILLPISSLPSQYGIGCFSKEAYEFVDQLALANQKYWQILPLGPTSYGDSPYQSFSTYAGNPYFIDLNTLIEEGVLTKKECNLALVLLITENFIKPATNCFEKLMKEAIFPKIQSSRHSRKKTHGGSMITPYLWP